MSFIHLHCHTRASEPDGQLSPENLCEIASGMGVAAIALTDHGNMYSVPEFCRSAREFEVRPIIGCELRVESEDEGRSAWHHIVLLAENQDGYFNLVRLVNAAHADGYAVDPPVPARLIFEHSDGLIALSGCRRGLVPALLGNGRIEEAQRTAMEYATLFGPDRFYVEIQHSGLPDQDSVNQGLAELAQALGLPVVATANLHSFERASGVEVAERLSCYPSALQNTQKIAEMCRVDLRTVAKRRARGLKKPADSAAMRTVESLSRERLKWRRKRPPPASAVATPRRAPSLFDYETRLDRELARCAELGMADYLLKVASAVDRARQSGAVVAPGGAPGYASLLFYALGITALDPLLWDQPDEPVSFLERGRPAGGHLFTSEVDVRDILESCGADSDICKPCCAMAVDDRQFLAAFLADAERVQVSTPILEAISLLNPAGWLSCESLERMLRFVREQGATDEMRALFQVYRRHVNDFDHLPHRFNLESLDFASLDEAASPGIPFSRGRHDNLLSQYSATELNYLEYPCLRWTQSSALTHIRNAEFELRGTEIVTAPDSDIPSLPLDLPEVFGYLATGDLSGIYRLDFESSPRLIKQFAPTTLEQLAGFLAIDHSGYCIDSTAAEPAAKAILQFAKITLTTKLHFVSEATICYWSAYLKMRGERPDSD